MRTMILAALFSAACLFGDSTDEPACSNATLTGQYGFTITGMRPSGPPPAPIEQIVGVALTVFDGEGKLTQTDNVHGSVSGYPASAVDRPGTGTYSINADCSGTMTLSNLGAPTLTLRIVVVNAGREVYTAVVGPAPVLVTSHGVKVVKRSIHNEP